MPMYTAASPGNLLPKFSGPKMPPGPAGTIAHRASVLQKATGVVAAGYLAAGAHCVGGGAPTPGPAPANATAPRSTTRRANLDVTVSPLLEVARHPTDGRQRCSA
jgi:hypothetical protein